jgi:hypothetical protein
MADRHHDEVTDIPPVASRTDNPAPRFGPCPPPPAPYGPRRPWHSSRGALEFQARKKTRQPALTMAVEAAVGDIEQQSNPERPIARFSSRILKSILPQDPVSRSPWLWPWSGEDDSVFRRQPRRIVCCSELFGLWPTVITQVETVGSHEVYERVAAGLVPCVLDCSFHKERSCRIDLRYIVRRPGCRLRRITVRRELP